MGGPGSGRRPGGAKKIVNRLMSKPHKVSSKSIKKMNVGWRKKERKERRISGAARAWEFNMPVQLKFANKHRYD